MAEQERIKRVAKSIKSTGRILENMRSLHQQALTKKKHDLLPPEARLLVRATLPEMPSNKSTLWIFFEILIATALTMAIAVFCHRKVRSRKNEALAVAVPAMPIDVGLGERTPEIAVQSMGAECKPSITADSADFDLQAVGNLIVASQSKRIVLLSEEPAWSGQANALASILMEMDQAVLLVDLGSCSTETQKPDFLAAGISDLIDQRARYADLVLVDEDSELHHIDCGSRALTADDFFNHELHALILALEEACDIVLIDLGEHFDNDYALKALGIARDALACIHAPETDGSVAGQVKDVMAHFGYGKCLIVPHDCVAQGTAKPAEQLIAAE